MWLGITEITWKPSHAVLDILTSEYEKQKQLFVEYIISNGPGTVTHTINVLLVTILRTHIQVYLILRDIYDMDSKTNP